MTGKMRDYFIKPLLMLAIAVPAMSAVNVSEAKAGKRTAAFIAGAIIGGVVAHKIYRKRYKKRYRVYHAPRRHGYVYYAPRRHGYYVRRHHGARRYHRANRPPTGRRMNSRGYYYHNRR